MLVIALFTTLAIVFLSIILWFVLYKKLRISWIKTSHNSDINEKELWYNALFQTEHNAIFIIENNVIIDCNQKATELFGATKANILGHTPFDFSPEFQAINEPSQELGEMHIRDAIKNKHTTFEWIHKRANGTLFNAEVSLSGITIKNRTFVTAYLRDISERKQIEAELATYQLKLEVIVSEKTEDFETVKNKLQNTNTELSQKNIELQNAIETLENEILNRNLIQSQLELSEEKYRSFLLQSGLGIVLFDASGQISEWNYKMTEYTGIEKDDALKEKVWNIQFLLIQQGSEGQLRYEKFQTIVEDYLQRLPNAPVVNVEACYYLNSEKIDLSVTFFPIQTKKGITIGQIFKDITESKVAENELNNYRTELENLVIKRTGEVMDFSQRYQKILRNTSDAIFLIDVRILGNHRIISVNHVLEKLLGKSETEIVNKGLIEAIFDNELSEKMKESVDDCLFQQAPIERLEPLEIEGQKHFFKTLFVPLKDDTGLIYQIACFSRDVTAEQRIREEQEFNSVLFNNVQSLILVVDTEGRIIRFNNACEILSGLNSDSVKGKYFWEIIHSSHVQETAKLNFINIRDTQMPAEMQSSWLTLYGRTHEIIWHCSFINNKLGQAQYLIITGTDLTERLEIERALRKSENKFRNIFNNSLDGIAITSKNRYFVETNPIILIRTGYTKEELLNMRTFDIISPHDHKILSNRLTEMLQGKDLIFFETEIITKSNEHIPVELNGKLIEYEGNPAILMFIRDITERKQLENRLMKIVVETEEKERKAMAGDLHDELGPLLASLQMYTSTLSRKLNQTEHKNVLDILQKIIKEAVEKTRELSNNLSPLLLETFGLEAAIKSEIENTQLILPVKLTCNLNEKRFESRVETVFYRTAKELMNNTRKYANASEAEIFLTLNGSALNMTYSDNGIGFDYVNYNKSNQTGIGLLNIGNRARSINASYNIKTSPGRGFQFSLQCEVKIN